jgi:hypothetical protein
VLVEKLMGSPAPARVARALGERRAPTSLGGGKGHGRGAESVGPSYREQDNGQHGKGFSAEAITYWAAGDTAEEGEGDPVDRWPYDHVDALFGLPIVNADAAVGLDDRDRVRAQCDLAPLSAKI